MHEPEPTPLPGAQFLAHKIERRRFLRKSANAIFYGMVATAGWCGRALDLSCRSRRGGRGMLPVLLRALAVLSLVMLQQELLRLRDLDHLCEQRIDLPGQGRRHLAQQHSQ